MRRIDPLACLSAVLFIGLLAAPAEAGFVTPTSQPFTQQLSCTIPTTPASSCATAGVTTPSGMTVAIENVTFRCNASAPVSVGFVTATTSGTAHVYNFASTDAPDPTGRINSVSSNPTVIWLTPPSSINATFLFTAAVSPGASCIMTVSGEQF